MKYNISLSGRGSDSRIFKITDNEYSYLKESGVEEDKTENIEYSNYWSKGFYYLLSEKI